MKLKLILVHGAFQGGFVWKSILPRLQAFDYDVLAPTLRGNSLTDDIDQVCSLLSTVPTETRVTLLGHSYGSLVVTGVAKQFPERINGLIYLDAPIPTHPHGEPQSLLDILGPGPTEFFMSRTTDGIVKPFPPEAFGLSAETHHETISEHRDQALACFTEKGASWALEENADFPISYIQCAPNDFTDEQANKARALHWNIHTIPESGHCPMITHPGELLRLLHGTIFPQIHETEAQKEATKSSSHIVSI